MIYFRDITMTITDQNTLMR